MNLFLGQNKYMYNEMLRDPLLGNCSYLNDVHCSPPGVFFANKNDNLLWNISYPKHIPKFKIWIVAKQV